MNNPWLYKSLKLILIITIFIISCLYLLRLISDPDFFWHLKTGEWIWQNKSLPSEDLFAYTTPQAHSSREHFILTSYWLSQLTYYLIYLAGRLQSIIIARFIVTGLLIYVMLRLKKGDEILDLGLLIIFFIVLLNYPIERPQVFSFLFFAMLLYLLEKIKEIDISPYTLHAIRYTFPLLMLIWANMHGGHVLGQITIILYIVMEGIKFIHPSLKPIGKRAYKWLLIAGISGIIFSLINPNTYHALKEIMSIPPILHKTTENFSSIESLKVFNDYTILLYWFILLLTVIGLILNFFKIDITETALLLGTGYFSFTTMRYIPFFMIAALPVMGRYFSGDKLLKISRVLIFAIAILAGVFFGWKERDNLNNVASDSWIDKNIVPVKATDFIIANNLKGNMYNHYDWGGYLIWRLAPERKVFIDGRNLYEHVRMQSVFVNIAFTKDVSGMPMWKHILERYNVNYVIIPLFEMVGIPFPLTYALLKDSDWMPVFFNPDSRILIFVKNSPENYHVISRYAIPKDYFLAKIPKVKIH